MSDDLIRVQKDEWKTIVRLLDRINDHCLSFLEFNPDDGENTGQIQKWTALALNAAWKGSTER